jgi:hypothetical protein
MEEKSPSLGSPSLLHEVEKKAQNDPSARRVRRLFFAPCPDGDPRDALRRATRKTARHSGGKPVSPAKFAVALRGIARYIAINAG